jgi:hypothetical protein
VSFTGTFTNGGVSKNPTFDTLVVRTALQLNAGAVFDLYNTADKTTDYERLTGRWDSNVAKLMTQFGGSAASRFLQIGCASGAGSNTVSTYLQLQASSSASVAIGLIAGSWTGASTMRAAATLASSSGTQILFAVDPTINQSGTAGYTVLDLNPTETATGSGTKLLLRAAVGGVAVATITNAGFLSANNLYASGSFNLSSSFGSAQDVTLTRDAAETLALRRSTNAQTFRVYNTYTDASNGEWGFVRWAANEFLVGNSFNGTGVVRPMSFQIANVTRWTINTSGNFIAGADNTYDIGASGANRPRAIYAALAINAPEWRMSVVTVAGLSGTNNSRMMVSDSTLPFASANIGTAVTGGGANTVPVIRIGGTWYIG